MQKRRQAFLHRIRSQQKEEIKQSIRQSLLQQPSTQAGDNQTHFWIAHEGRRQQQSGYSTQLGHKMKEILYTKLNYSASNEECTAREVFDVFSSKLKCATQQNDLIDIVEAYREGVNLQGISPANTISCCKQWQNVFNMIMLKIKVFAITTHSSIPQTLFIDSQLDLWRKHNLAYLQDIKKADYQQITSSMHDNVQCIIAEQLQLLTLLSPSPQGLLQLADNIFDQQMIYYLCFLLRLHFIDQSMKALITEIFLQMTKKSWSSMYKRILENDFIDYMRMVIAYEQDYKQLLSSENRIKKQLVTNMLQFVVYGSYLAFSDQYVQNGLCSELVAVEKECKDKMMRCNIITVVFVCITNFKYQRTLELIQKESLYFDWLLEVIRQMIDSSYGDALKLDIISDGIQVIRFFLAEGDRWASNSMNPYRLKLQYSSADMVLSNCKEGRALLREIGWDVQQL